MKAIISKLDGPTKGTNGILLGIIIIIIFGNWARPSQFVCYYRSIHASPLGKKLQSLELFIWNRLHSNGSPMNLNNLVKISHKTKRIFFLLAWRSTFFQCFEPSKCSTREVDIALNVLQRNSFFLSHSRSHESRFVWYLIGFSSFCQWISMPTILRHKILRYTCVTGAKKTHVYV